MYRVRPRYTQYGLFSQASSMVPWSLIAIMTDSAPAPPPPFTPFSHSSHLFPALSLPHQDEKHCIGALSQKTRKIRIVNVLTQQENILEVCSEEAMREILDRCVKTDKTRVVQ